jgi:dTDP-4-amino-4,6-dideoxygalactose transaminase
LEARRIVLADSGTSALQIAMRAAVAGGRGGVIGLPAWGCYDILSAAQGADVAIDWYDLDPETLQPRMESVARLAERRPSAIVLVHAYGVPIDVATVRDLVGDEIILIEDAAQAWGAALNGVHLGAWGDLSVFSFGRGKGVTGGRGGAVVIRSARADRFAEGVHGVTASAGWRDVGMAFAIWLLARPSLYAIPAAMPWLRLGETVYKPPRPAGSMSLAAATMIAHSISIADGEAAKRATIAHRLRRAVESSDMLDNVRPVDGAAPSWLRLPVLSNDATTRRRLLDKGRRSGVGPGYPRNLPSIAEDKGASAAVPEGSFPGSEQLARRLITLPTHSRLQEEDVSALERLIQSADET